MKLEIQREWGNTLLHAMFRESVRKREIRRGCGKTSISVEMHGTTHTWIALGMRRSATTGAMRRWFFLPGRHAGRRPAAAGYRARMERQRTCGDITPRAKLRRVT